MALAVASTFCSRFSMTVRRSSSVKGAVSVLRGSLSYVFKTASLPQSRSGAQCMYSSKVVVRPPAFVLAKTPGIVPNITSLLKI